MTVRSVPPNPISAAGILRGSERQGRQLDGDGPAFGEVDHMCDLIDAEPMSADPLDDLLGLGLGEPKVVGTRFTSSPRDRRRWLGMLGSEREAIMKWTREGASPTSRPRSSTDGPSSRSRSSSTTTMSSSTACRSSSRRSMTSSPSRVVAMRRAAEPRSPTSGRAAKSAATRRVPRRTGSASRSSIVSQAVRPLGRVDTHWPSRTDFP